jgi:Flp pilus assembly pilin Flp
MWLGLGKMSDWLQCLINREKGQSMVEYALLVAMLAMAAISIMDSLAVSINSVFIKMSTTFSTSI